MAKTINAHRNAITNGTKVADIQGERNLIDAPIKTIILHHPASGSSFTYFTPLSKQVNNKLTSYVLSSIKEFCLMNNITVAIHTSTSMMSFSDGFFYIVNANVHAIPIEAYLSIQNSRRAITPSEQHRELFINATHRAKFALEMAKSELPVLECIPLDVTNPQLAAMARDWVKTNTAQMGSINHYTQPQQ